MRNPMTLLGYLLGGAMSVAGLLILFGVLELRAGNNSAFGTLFGVVLLLFGLYRIAVTQGKQRREMREGGRRN